MRLFLLGLGSTINDLRKSDDAAGPVTPPKVTVPRVEFGGGERRRRVRCGGRLLR